MVNLGSFISPNNSFNAFFCAAVPAWPSAKPTLLSINLGVPFSIVFWVYLNSGRSFGCFIFSACSNISSIICLDWFSVAPRVSLKTLIAAV